MAVVLSVAHQHAGLWLGLLVAAQVFTGEELLLSECRNHRAWFAEFCLPTTCPWTMHAA